MAGKSAAKSLSLKPRFRVVCGSAIAFGPGKAALLELLVATGSLNEAARRLGMSYMRAWTLVNAMNECFREPLIVAARGGKAGGGMKVTDAGRRALELYQRMEMDGLRAVQADWRALRKLLRE